MTISIHMHFSHFTLQIHLINSDFEQNATKDWSNTKHNLKCVCVCFRLVLTNKFLICTYASSFQYTRNIFLFFVLNERKCLRFAWISNLENRKRWWNELKEKKILYATKCNCLHSFEYLDFNYIVFFRLKRNKKKNLTLQMVVAFVSISDVVILIVICCCCCMHA